MRASILAAALLLTPAIASADPPSAAHKVGTGMWISGLSLWATTYLATAVTTTAIVAANDGRAAAAGEAWIPLVGPWVMLADSSGYTKGEVLATTTGGVLQTIGASFFFTGVILSAATSRSSAKITVAPTLGGVTIGGSF